MVGRIVEIADDRRHLSVFRGFLMVHTTGGTRQLAGKVPLDDITALIANAHGISYTNNLLVDLAERGCPFVLCGANHNVAGMLWPIDGHHVQAKRMEAQIAASLPVQKRMWASVVRAKLQQQAAVLEACGAPDAPLNALVRKVRSGDPDNIEAQGARRYWGLLFGDGFKRDQKADGVNALLNYGYTILRATTARAVIAAGLHPSIGLHHSNDANAMRLVDDLMEPFRPMVDLKVRGLIRQGLFEVTPETKKALALVMCADLQTSAGATPIMVCTQRLAVSLAQVFLGERQELDLPLPGSSLDMGAMASEVV